MNNMEESKRNPNAPRGMGRERFEALLKQRPSKKLKDGDHLLYHHALRCLCQRCGTLIDWDCPEDLSYTIAECCGIEYRLMPWTVKIETNDISSRPILPTLDGSSYSDPDFDLASQMVGNLKTIETVTTKPLSRIQLGLGGPFPAPTKQIQEPKTYVIPAKGYLSPTSKPRVPVASSIPAYVATRSVINGAKVRRCSICKTPGHNRRTCPDRQI